MDEVLGAWSVQDQAVFAQLLERFVGDLRAVRYRAIEDETEVGAHHGQR